MSSGAIPNLDNHLHLEAFFISAISGLLLVRFYLYLTGFPQVGGGGLHIAHMLWGGLLMLVGLILLITFFGRVNRRLSAVLAGAGFGIFLDELGKFLTSDNNYFFRPAAAIIYAVFLAVYVAMFLLLRRGGAAPSTQLALALQGMVEAVGHGLDRPALQGVRRHLDQADPDDPVTQAVINLLDHLHRIPAQRPGPLRRLHVALDRWYDRCIDSEILTKGVILLFTGWAVVHTLTDAVSVFGIIGSRTVHGQVSAGGANLAVALLTLVSVALVIVGDVFMVRSQLHRGSPGARSAAPKPANVGPSRPLLAYISFKWAMLLTIFLTTEFEFYLVQFYALAGLAQAIVGLVIANGLSHREQRRMHAAALAMKTQRPGPLSSSSADRSQPSPAAG